MPLITRKNKKRHRIQFTMSGVLYERYRSYQVRARNLGLAINLNFFLDDDNPRLSNTKFKITPANGAL